MAYLGLQAYYQPDRCNYCLHKGCLCLTNSCVNGVYCLLARITAGKGDSVYMTNNASVFIRTTVFLLWSIVTLPMITCCSGSSSGTEDNWTYMVYMAADNNISEAAEWDINEMEQVGSTSSVNIVVQVEFSQTHSKDMPENTLRGRITKDNNQFLISSDLKDIGNKDMTDKNTLKAFIEWAASTYPAQHYALVLWSHGLGWRSHGNVIGFSKGMMEDDTSSGSGNIMGLSDLADAIETSNVDLDLIDFDTCLLGMYEVAYECRGLADYITFSEEIYPGLGNPYDTILYALVGQSGMSALTLAETITNKCKEFYQASDTTFTKSAVDMSYIDELHTDICYLAGAMIEDIHEQRANIQSARDQSVYYDYPQHHDLGDFLDNLDQLSDDSEISAGITGIKQTMNAMVVGNSVHSSIPGDPINNSQGIAIYLPKSSQVSQDDLSAYSLLECNSSASDTWGGFVNLLVSGDTSVPIRNVTGNFSIRISWDTDADVDLYIFEPSSAMMVSPYDGIYSPINGVFSQDSAVSGLSEEYYEAFEDVEQGEYNIYIDYYKDGPNTDTTTTVSYYLMDPESGINTYTLQAQRSMDLSNPIPYSQEQAITENTLSNVYSDWWRPSNISRSYIISDRFIDTQVPDRIDAGLFLDNREKMKKGSCTQGLKE